MKIRQSYHGTGGKEGYLYEVYDNKVNKLGYLDSIPIKANTGDIVRINKSYYKINKQYDCQLPESEDDEVVWYELEEYEFKADFDLGIIRTYSKLKLDELGLTKEEVDATTNQYGGTFTIIDDLPIGTKFYVNNGGWQGKIVDNNGVKSVLVDEDDEPIPTNRTKCLWITIK